MVYFSHMVHLRLIVSQLGGIFYFPTQELVIIEYQLFNIYAVQIGYGFCDVIECKAAKTKCFQSYLRSTNVVIFL